MPQHRRVAAAPSPTLPSRWVGRGVCLALASALLAGCTADASLDPAPSPTVASPSPSVTATAEETDTHEPFPDRPESTVEPWPDHGDFAIDITKAATPAGALAQAERWDDYDYMTRITGTAQARWIGSWSTNDAIANYARQVYTTAAETDRIGLISYFGMRDYTCEDAAADPALEEFYVERSRVLVEELPNSGARAWIVLEPTLIEDLGSCEGDPRGAWVAQAAAILADAGAAVYLDAGIVDDPEAIAQALEGVELARVAGIAVGTNGYRAVSEQVAAGEQILASLADAGVAVDAPRAGADPGQPGLGLIVDTSRSGVPIEEAEPCNPPQAGIGVPPRIVAEGRVDAHVWIKRVGESDGACNGGPTRGQFSQAIALQLAQQGSLVEQ